MCPILGGPIGGTVLSPAPGAHLQARDPNTLVPASSGLLISWGLLGLPCQPSSRDVVRPSHGAGQGTGGPVMPQPRVYLLSP